MIRFISDAQHGLKRDFCYRDGRFYGHYNRLLSLGHVDISVFRYTIQQWFLQFERENEEYTNIESIKRVHKYLLRTYVGYFNHEGRLIHSKYSPDEWCEKLPINSTERRQEYQSRSNNMAEVKSFIVKTPIKRPFTFTIRDPINRHFNEIQSKTAILTCVGTKSFARDYTKRRQKYYSCVSCLFVARIY